MVKQEMLSKLIELLIENLSTSENQNRLNHIPVKFINIYFYLMENDIAKKAAEEPVEYIINILSQISNELLSDFQPEKFELLKETIYSIDSEDNNQCLVLAIKFAELCWGVALNPSTDNISMLKEILPLKYNITRWFIPQSEIIEATKLIREKNINLSDSAVIASYSLFYLHHKLVKEMLHEFKLYSLHDGLEKNTLQIINFNERQNIKYKNADPEKNMTRKILFFFDSIKNELKINNPDKLFNALFSFKTEGMEIAPLYETGICNSEIKMSDKLVLFFNLFRLLLKDRNWMTEEEFENRFETDNNGNPVVKYRGRYRQYKIDKMKKFLTKK